MSDIKRTIWLEKCGDVDCEDARACGISGGHVHFYDAVVGKCPLPTASVEATEKLLNILAKDGSVSPEEMTRVHAEIAAATLPERASEEELARLVETEQFLKLLDDVMIG